MQFDANRLARLAGLGRQHQTIITESTQVSEIAEVDSDDTTHVDDHGQDQDKYLDEVIEIDEVSLKQEIIALKQERLAENRLRDVIRHELGDILETSGYVQDGSWVYGDNKPTRSKKGHVTLGTLGLGFK